MKKIYQIKGMHCRSCEVLLENEVKKIEGVKEVHASTKKGTVVVTADTDLSSEVVLAVESLDYKIGTRNLPWLNLGGKHLLELLFATASVLVLLWVFRSFNIQSLLSPTSFASSNLAAIFTIGLTAGVSSCMALVGGLVFGISARHAEKHPGATVLQKFRPHLFFNLGRLASFFVLGGLIGELGSFFRVSGPALGFMIIVVGLVMFFLSLQLMEISPKISGFTLPKFLSGFASKKDKEYSHKNALLLGALTFFLPCGFTQAAQIYAISTGSFWQGALIMFFFALGTTPGLLGIGGLTSAIKKGVFSRYFFKVIGVFVLVLALYNIRNGFNLVGFALPENGVSQVEQETTNVGPEEGPGSSNSELQLIKAVYDPKDIGSQYVIEPREFTVKVGKPVRFEILAKQDGLGCMGSITLPGLSNTFRVFEKGESAVFEFTPTRTGDYKITCAMGIDSGTIRVEK